MRVTLDHRPNSGFLAELFVVPVILGAEKQAGKNEKKGRSGSHPAPWAGLDQNSARKLQEIDRHLGGDLSARIKLSGFRFEPGKRFELPIMPRLVSGVKGAVTRLIKLYVIGSVKAAPGGGQRFGTEHNWRIIGGDAGQTAKNGSYSSIAVEGSMIEGSDSAEAARLSAFVEGFILGRYQYTAYKSKPAGAGPRRGKEKKPNRPATVAVLSQSKPTKAAAAAFKGVTQAAERRAAAVTFCRDLVNRPPSDLHPVDLVKATKKIAAARGSQISLQTYGRARLKSLGANGILTVARGSGIEPFLIHATYRPARKSRTSKRIVLVGKGVTFDSGGLSIKTGKGMEDMKCDMAGAAVVISVLKAIAESPKSERPIHEIHVLVPTVENLINENSVKPGDVFFALNGKSVEVLNTDAEGRLILADALSYSARLKPDLIVDLATLTGACVAALGSDYAGLFSTDKDLETSLVNSGQITGDLVWPLPLAKEYRPMINSSVADIQNIGPGGPGAITAALFLQEFVPPKTPWAHLDIAGPAFVTRGNEVVRPGGSGFGVRLMLRLVGMGTLPGLH